MSARVGIISDTHDLLRPEVTEVLKACDYILHAGDITKESLLDQIRFLGRLYVVRGNNDGAWAAKLKVRLRFQIEGVSFLMAHRREQLGSPLGDADVIIYGHTHRYQEERKENRLWLNPGTCSRPRFGGGCTMALMEIDGDRYRVERIDLG